MATTAIYFFRRFRPAYWLGETLDDALDAARRATRDMPGSEGQKLRAWMATAIIEMQSTSPRYAASITEDGRSGLYVIRDNRNPFQDRARNPLPHAPGLDYSECSNLSEDERSMLIDDGIGAEADRSRA